MRLFHVSDLHLGIRLMNYDLTEEQNYILNQIVQYIKQYQPDVLIIAGDVFDRSTPSANALRNTTNGYRIFMRQKKIYK